MAIEVQAQNTQNSILQQGQQAGGALKNTIQNQILQLDKNDEKEENGRQKDKVTISEQAAAFLNGANTNNSADKNTRFSQDSLEVQSLQFRGLAQSAARRELNDDERSLVSDIRNNFAKIGVETDAGILKIAEQKLLEVRQETQDLVQLVSGGQATGEEFNRLNTINKLLNNSNGFGSEQVEGSLQTRLTQLSKQFEDAIAESENKKIDGEKLKNLEKLEREISAIQGYQLNIRDAIGPDGVIV